MRYTLACLLILLTALPVLAQDKPASEWTKLFDGQSLTGWHGSPHLNPDEYVKASDEQKAQWNEQLKGHWTVDNGELVNDGAGPYLVTDQDYGDIELKLQYKTVAKADSGIYLRDTPQVQIWDTTEEAKFGIGANLGSGGLFNNSNGAPGRDPLVLADKPFGEWNEVHVIQVGARTTVYLNGKLVVDHAIMENYWNRDQPLQAKGHIQLQTHGGEIRWKDVMVREIGAEEANQILASHSGEGFESVFDGQSLQGWAGAVDDYEVVDGAIRCKDKRGGNLYTEANYDDFQVRVEFRLPPGGNNGLAIRFAGQGDPAYQAFCELQVLDNDAPQYAKLDPRQYHGSAYGMKAAARGYLRETGQWNFQEVTVKGAQVKVELNGTVILDADLSDVKEFMAGRPHPGLSNRSGHFGFAGHNDPVQFRKVSIKRLSSDSEPSSSAAQ